MTANRRSLKDYFDAARSESSPMSADAAREIASNAAATGTARSPLMSPTLLATSAAVIIAAAGVTVKVIHDSDTKPQTKLAPATTSITAPPSIMPPATSHPGGTTPNPVSTVVPTDTDGGDDGNGDGPSASSRSNRTAKGLTVERRMVIRDGSQTTDLVWTSNDADLAVFALRADDDVFRSLGLEPKAVQSICKNLAGADSVTDCSFEHPEPQMKICMFTNGSTDEVVFMDRPGPMPVMFTSADGKGRIVASQFHRSTDPNKLVPVAAPGCGSTMLMWFEPTQEFVFSMPDSLGEELEQMIDMEVRIETKDGATTITRRQRTADGTTLLEDVEEVNMSMDSILKDIDVNVLKNIDASTINIRRLLDSVDLNLDQILDADGLTVDTLQKDHKVMFRFKTMGANSTALNVNLKKIEQEVSVRSPSIRHRVIILNSSKQKQPTPPLTSRAPVMLQESRFTQGAVTATSLFPNPTSDGGATISFELAEPRSISLELLNLNGESIAQLAQNSMRSAGSGRLNFPLNGVAPGMYLVALTTDHGERAVQRLIVQ